jgi:Mg-chelatase subunit ChlD
MSISLDRYQRWRLLLGDRAEPELLDQRARRGGDGDGRGALLDDETHRIDRALGAVYDAGAPPDAASPRGAGLGRSAPHVAAWLGDIRAYFPSDVIEVLQKDALERRGWTEILRDPEALRRAHPSVDLVCALLAMKDLIPEETRETARAVVREVVEAIRRRMTQGLERAVRGARRGARRRGPPSLPDLDVSRTITQNLRNYRPDLGRIIPDRFFFHARQHRRRQWSVIVCMDQSASMAESVVYGAIMGASFASIPALETRVLAFDTEVVDLTAELDVPVEMLFGLQLGGGTDIHRAVAHAEGLITNPLQTLFILITDLHEGGDEDALVRRLEALVQSGVRALCLLALSDAGAPSYHVALARRLTAAAVPCFACTPSLLPEVLEAALAGRDLAAVTRAR